MLKAFTIFISAILAALSCVLTICLVVAGLFIFAILSSVGTIVCIIIFINALFRIEEDVDSDDDLV